LRRGHAVYAGGSRRCGVFAHGFIRARCDHCGHDLLVAFSCKARSICPSCAGRRMANTAANLVDRVLPAVPIRRWVLTLPWDLRALAAFKSDVLSALVRIFAETLFTRYQKWATSRNASTPWCGAITHVQRFGSSLNLTCHIASHGLAQTYPSNIFGRRLQKTRMTCVSVHPPSVGLM
jgi:hypothetical protein